MKRAFRVATVFTGAAACAAAMTPAAQAAAVVPGAMAGVTPDANAHNCQPRSTAAVHLYYEASENHPTPGCVTGGGYVYIGTGKRFASYCGGGYSGSFEINGSWRHFPAGVAYHKLYGAEISAVYISESYIVLAQCKG